MKKLSGKFEDDLHKAARRGRFNVQRKPGDLKIQFKITYTLECPPGRRLTPFERALLRLSDKPARTVLGFALLFFLLWSFGAYRLLPLLIICAVIGVAGILTRAALLRLTFFVRFLPDCVQFGRAGKRARQYELPISMLTGFAVDEPRDREVQAAVFDVFIVTEEKKYVFVENVARKFGEELATKLSGLFKEFSETLEADLKAEKLTIEY